MTRNAKMKIKANGKNEHKGRDEEKGEKKEAMDVKGRKE